MAETVTDASPQPEGTNPLDGKPEGGNTPAGTGVGESQPEPPSYEDLQQQNQHLYQQNQTLNKNYSDSSRAAQQDRAEKQNLLMQNQQLQMNLQQMQQPNGDNADGFRSVEDIAKGLIDGVVDNDASAVGQTLKEVEERGFKRGQEATDERRTVETQKSARMSQSSALINWNALTTNGAPNTEDAFSNEVWNAYVSLYQAHQQGQFMNHIPKDEIAWNGGPLNPHLLKEAQYAVMQRGTAQAGTPAPQPAATGGTFVEPSGSGTPPATSRTPVGGQSASSLLSDGEKKTAKLYMKKGEMTDDEAYQRYYGKLPANVRRVREKTGRFVTTQDMIESAASVGKGGPG